MTGEYAIKLARVKTAMDNRYENKQANKKTDISGSFTGDADSYPTVQAVKTFVEGKGYLTQHQDISGKANSADLATVATSGSYNDLGNKPSIPASSSDLSDGSDLIKKSQTAGLVKNDGTIDTSTYLTQHQDISNYVQKSSTAGLIKNDGTIDTNTYLTQHQDISNYVQKSSTAGLIKNDGTIDTNTYLTTHQSLSDIGGVVDVVEKVTPNSGYLKTYQITQDGTSVGEIDIPKDFIVKSGSVKTVGSTATTAETAAGLTTGDVYLSLTLNTIDNSTSTGDEELIIPANGLVEDTRYAADNSTLSLNSTGNVFSIKAGGVDTTQIKDAAVTADKIASSVKNTWISTSDIDSRINQALDDLAESIYPTSS